jgi:hypothetical protein
VKTARWYHVVCALSVVLAVGGCGFSDTSFLSKEYNWVQTEDGIAAKAPIAIQVEKRSPEKVFRDPIDPPTRLPVVRTKARERLPRIGAGFHRDVETIEHAKRLLLVFIDV